MEDEDSSATSSSSTGGASAVAEANRETKWLGLLATTLRRTTPWWKAEAMCLDEESANADRIIVVEQMELPSCILYNLSTF
mmetsp:Transcript_15057/g.41877  ORF Transcript_15057/g.41877 Transcript_15057/m.41877 type:complete len:81 (-) Transcript_15057:177-419(-)